MTLRGGVEFIELANRVEDDLVAMGKNLFYLVICVSHGIGVCFAAEFLVPELDLIKRR